MSTFDTGVQFGDKKDKTPRNVVTLGPLDETPKKAKPGELPPPLIQDPAAFLKAVNAFEQVAAGQQGEEDHLLNMAGQVGKIKEQSADTHRKNAKARLDTASGVIKLQKDALELQQTKAETTLATGFVDDTDRDAAVAAMVPFFDPQGETIPGVTLGKVDPRSSRFEQFPALRSLNAEGVSLENSALLQTRLNELLKELPAARAEAGQLDLLNSPLGRGGVGLGAILNLLSLPVTAISGGQGLGTTLLGGPDVDRLNRALSEVRALTPLLGAQVSLANANVNAQQGMELNIARKLNAQASASKIAAAAAEDQKSAGIYTQFFTQNLANMVQNLGGDEGVFWRGNAVDNHGRAVEGGAGLELFRIFNALGSDKADDPKVKAALIERFDAVMASYFSGTGVSASFDTINKSISNLAHELRTRGTADLDTRGITADNSQVYLGTLFGFTEILGEDFRNFAKGRYEKSIEPDLKRRREGKFTERELDALKKVDPTGQKTLDLLNSLGRGVSR